MRAALSGAVSLPLWLPVALGAGVGVYFSLPAEPPLLVGVLGVGIPLALSVLYARRAGRSVCLLLLFCGLGFLAAQARTVAVDAPILDARLGPVEVEGTVYRWEEEAAGRGRLTVEAPTIERLGADQTPARVRVIVRTGGDRFAPGDRVRLPAVLNPPPAPVFPGDFDFARRLYFMEIGALGFSVGPVERVHLARVDDGWRARLEGLRTIVSSRIRSALPGEAGAVADALITGYRQALSEEAAESMRGAGLAHLLAISGLHLGLVTGFVFFLIRGGLALIPALALNYPIKKWAAAVALPAALFYLGLSGSGIPTTRAFIMAALVLFAILLDRNPISLRLVAVAAGIILLTTPEALLGASFQMSFAAVVALVAAFNWVTERRARRKGAPDDAARGQRTWARRLAMYFLAIVGTTLVAEVVLTAPTLYHFNRTALYGVAGNLVAMPVMAFWIMPVAVVAMLLMPLGLEEPAFALMGEGITLMLAVARSVSGAPGAEVLWPAFSATAYLAIMGGFLVLCLLKGRARLVLSAPLFVLGVAHALATPRPHVLVDSEADVMAVKAPDGLFWFSPGLGGRHARRVAAEQNGQADMPRWAWTRADHRLEGMTWLACDARGCVYTPKAGAGLTVALVHDPLAALEDCGRVDLIISFENLGPHCRDRAVVIDWPEIRANGGHAVYLDGGDIRVETVRAHRGARPWVR